MAICYTIITLFGKPAMSLCMIEAFPREYMHNSR